MRPNWIYTSETFAELLSSESIDVLTVEVWGDRNNASYEWIIKDSAGTIVGFSNEGFAQKSIAMLKGLERVMAYREGEIDSIHPE